ncbi:sensor protein [Mycolicibacterium phlei]|jgi:two-component system sensor histidine kinase TrcS|uniref:histidine kinase n=1 Tax=Mycolicibacterium phlei DSM 43239 = CCUG 21000 TaxID=1226750 RepID=A0A5N5UYP2_MYCPH|nr:HAMP domain-containing sensor histidine kinase [Mycolicibacterium phlei]VEG07859.1 sensor protein [Mycobacteroides chelonae]AMO59731.1 putative sensor histidine kinase TcrY [Mycolicibacterium phlei]EID10635.1 two component sensor histidine kinase TRCS [Mycolicibacterium phlei RIVM601174]KAB7753549.1 sensor histidine kinase [Mycolicibacterium phlei DSM 43239 = CCUG 21000]KXW62452.1 sensor histidine kinase [Mycolicibacterium phlei DSM 43239 = CCUG 21000]
MRRRWQSWSLRRQLVVGVSTVVAIALVTFGWMSVWSLRSSVLGILDAQLTTSAEGFSQSVTKYRTTPGEDGRLPAPGAMKPLTHLIGQAPDNVIALIQGGRVVDSAHFVDGEAVPAPSAVVDAIAAMSWSGTDPHTVKLPELGWYRMMSRPGDGDEIMVTGVSRAPAWEAMVRETAVVTGLTVIALLVTALSTVAIVRYALRPLRRVAATAAEVAALPLDRDHHTITPRVATGDTDPRTEVGLVGDTLNRLLDHVERALADVAASDRRMRQFITDASHELRTPLAAIHGYAELTRQDAAILPETTEYSLARIEAEAQRMNALVADLLLLARLDEGQDLDRTDVDLTDLVVDAVNDAAVSAPTHRWLTDVPDQPVWVRGDRARLHQTLANLLSNARVHTPEGTTVTTAVRTDGGEVEVTVRDDGPGIAPDLLPHLFERFVRADRSRSRTAGSFGLGLSIAASIVEAHGGTIKAQSLPGATIFSIRLPTVAAAAREHARVR